MEILLLLFNTGAGYNFILGLESLLFEIFVGFLVKNGIHPRRDSNLGHLSGS